MPKKETSGKTQVNSREKPIHFIDEEQLGAVTSFFERFTKSHERDAGSLDLFRGPLASGEIRPGKDLIKICDLPTTRGHKNNEDTTPNIRHTHSLSLRPMRNENVIAIDDYHVTAANFEEDGDFYRASAKSKVKVVPRRAESTETNTSYLSTDGALVSAAAIKDIMGTISLYLAKDKRGIPDEDKIIDIVFNQFKNISDIWRVIATQVPFN